MFFSDADRLKFLSLLRHPVSKGQLHVWAYCLMANHVHLIVVPSAEDALGREMRRLNSLYATYLNREQGWSGHVWETRFYSTPLGESHLWSAVRYVERNPVRAGLVAHATEYTWSSARAHCGLAADDILSGDLERAGHTSDWHAWLALPDTQRAQEVRDRTRTGRPCGGEGFVQKLEGILGRRLRKAKAGRKPKGHRGR